MAQLSVFATLCDSGVSEDMTVSMWQASGCNCWVLPLHGQKHHSSMVCSLRTIFSQCYGACKHGKNISTVNFLHLPETIYEYEVKYKI